MYEFNYITILYVNRVYVNIGKRKATLLLNNSVTIDLLHAAEVNIFKRRF